MASLVAFMDRKLPIEIIRLLKQKRLHPEFSIPDQVNELDIFKLDPSELPGRSQINSDEQAWPFFSEPYKNVKGKQAHLTNGRGNWEKTGNDGEVRDKSTGKRIGGKKNYVYYKRGASPKQKIKTDWVMHEYYVDDDDSCYKEDFVFRYVEKNPMGKRNTSTPDDDQPSHSLACSLASHAETYAEKTYTEVESQQPSTHCLGNGFLEVEPDTGNYVSATNTSTMEVEPRLLSDHSLFHDQRNRFAPITSSMVQPRLLPDHNLGFDPRYKFADDTSPMVKEVESRLLSNDNLVSDDQRIHFAPISSSMVMMHGMEFDHSMEFDPRIHFVPNTSSMLLPHQNLDSLMVGPQRLSNHNMAFDPMNHSAPCTSSMVGPQLLSNQNMVFDPINHSASITSSMQEEPRLLSNQNLVSDYSRNYFVPNTSSMVAHDQLLANHNFFSDPRNHFAPNSCLMGHPQQVAELFAQFTALNHSSVYAPQWSINPQEGSYSSLYSNSAFGNNCTLSSSQFHGGLEDAWIAQRNFQDKYPEEATGQDSSY